MKNALILTVFCLLVASVAVAEEKMKEEKFSMNALAVGTMRGAATTFAYITITRWTTDTEREELARILMEESSNRLVNALFKQEPTGTFKIQGKLAYTLRYAREFDVDGKRRIVLATDRPISFQELKWSSRSSTYDIALIVLDVDAEGKGEGTLSAATKVKYNEKTQSIELESFTYDPVRLLNVKRTSE